MEPILQYIHNDILPSDKREARLVREQAPMYIIQNKSYCGPMMQCVGPIEEEMIIDEVHNGSYALHSGYKTIAVKIMRMAKAVHTITGVQVKNFVWEYIVCRFDIPRELVSDNGAQIAKDPFKTWYIDLNIIQKFTSVAHPQANGLCEVTNRHIVSVIPAEILVPTHIFTNFKEEANDDALGENLNFIEERRLMAAIRKENNKQQIAKYYNKRVRALSFDIGEWVLRNNDASRAEKLGKLGPN
ncbi:uncharacterized protein [Rutidosis leptorrhynchoides]|uniref:uncharacterized protein n=1 Tax=Rutidosis leptorrhynchoides TaxID=125765 RepID=UPI003A98D47A